MRFIIQCSVLFIIALNIISCGSDASSSKVKESEKPAATFVMKGDNKDGSNAKVTTKPNNNNRPARKTVNQASEGAFSAGPSTNSNTAKSYEGVDKFNGVPNACTLISIKEIASIFGMKAEAITRKDASHTKSPFTRSCFFKWDGASPNTGILLQVQANPVAEEYAEWVSLYVESKRTSGEKEMGSNDTYKYDKLEGLGDDGSYSHRLGKYIWRDGNKYAFMVAFNTNSAPEVQMKNVQKIGKIMMDNYAKLK